MPKDRRLAFILLIFTIAFMATIPNLTFIITLFNKAQAQSMNSHKSGENKTRKRPQQRLAYYEELTSFLKSQGLACNQDNDCDALAVGAQTCGGPREYLVVTKQALTKDPSKINDLTKVIAQMDREYDQANGVMGICTVLEKPKTTCVSGQCQKST